MALQTSRLDKFIADYLSISRKAVKAILAKGRVKVDHVTAQDGDLIINRFSHIVLDSNVIQHVEPIYLMLHKPVGVVCATKDTQHKTVIDLIEHDKKEDLHIVGRLDLNTSGLVLLTNDSRWSEALTCPTNKVEKCYLVTLKQAITSDYISAFAQGMYFRYENITTMPAKLTLLNEHQAHVVLMEGKYHQIKRMFGRFRNPVVALHRLSVGHITLDEALTEGQSRPLTLSEIGRII